MLTGIDAGLQIVTTSGSFCKIDILPAKTGGSCLIYTKKESGNQARDFLIL